MGAFSLGLVLFIAVLLSWGWLLLLKRSEPNLAFKSRGTIIDLVLILVGFAAFAVLSVYVWEWIVDDWVRGMPYHEYFKYMVGGGVVGIHWLLAEYLFGR
jgi:hypothetical protein